MENFEAIVLILALISLSSLAATFLFIRSKAAESRKLNKRIDENVRRWPE